MHHAHLPSTLCVLSLLAAGCVAKTIDVLRPEGETFSQDDDEPVQCLNGGYCSYVSHGPVELADLLFVVDNSGSMREEQASLREQFPKLITALTTGRKANGETFPHLRDIHLGVVSTDMGLAGLENNFPGCNTQQHFLGGDDGVLQHPGSRGDGCQDAYPEFLAYVEGEDDPERVATDFGCIAALGTAGCGFEQPLEAALKALWPKSYVDADGQAHAGEQNPIRFLSATSEGRVGHGDGANAGFLRSREQGRALLAIVVVTDEEDCSASSVAHYVSTNDPNNPLSSQSVNLRCYLNKQNLYDVERYVKAYRGLRPGVEQTVVFAAVVGVPVDLVSTEAREGVDFGDATARDAYYKRMLDDPRMQEQIVGGMGVGNLTPSCTRTDQSGERADAYAPRRIVEVARRMGANGIVQSICQDDFGPAFDELIDLAASHVRTECIPEPRARRADGTVACEVFWYMPKGEQGCDAFPFLSEVSSPRSARNARRGPNCKVRQLAVNGDEVAEGDGFYYDDFSLERSQACRSGDVARIAWSLAATPPDNVKVVIDCEGSP